MAQITSIKRRMDVEVVDIRIDSCSTSVIGAKCVGTDLLCEGRNVDDNECEPDPLVNVSVGRSGYDFYLIIC